MGLPAFEGGLRKRPNETHGVGILQVLNHLICVYSHPAAGVGCSSMWFRGPIVDPGLGGIIGQRSCQMLQTLFHDNNGNSKHYLNNKRGCIVYYIIRLLSAQPSVLAPKRDRLPIHGLKKIVRIELRNPFDNK